MSKIILIAALLGSFASAQVPAMGDLADKAKVVGTEKFKALAENCKEEKVKYCKDKTMAALKACLIENKSNLSEKCKKAVGI